MDNKEKIIAQLGTLKLTDEEARLYVELLIKPNTHLQLSRNTGINRTKVYRVVEQLEKRSLVFRRTDDRGMFLMANDPSALEIEIITKEEALKWQRAVFEQVQFGLEVLVEKSKNPFVVHTYEGIEGLKQMLWHELKTEGELLVFGNTTVEQLILDHRWAEKFRERGVTKGYRVRELFNTPHAKPDFTTNSAFFELYAARVISAKELPLSTPMIIYNDTVELFQFHDQKRVGVEIINAAHARTIRQIFEHYWRQAQPLDNGG